MLKKQKNRIYQYLGIILLGELFYFLVVVLSHGSGFTCIIFGDHYDTFADFFKPLYAWSGNPYQEGAANYPALATMMFRLVHHMIPKDVAVGSGLEYRSVNYAWVAFILFNIFSIWLACLSVDERLSLDKNEKRLFSLTIFLSAPVLFALERGNQVNLAFALTAFFVFFYENDNKIVRGLAYFSLSVAAALKIYPAIYGFLLVKERKWKESIRLAGCGAVVFLMPFLYYGKGSIHSFVESLISFSGGLGNHFAYNYALSSIVTLFGTFFGVSLPKSVVSLICIVVNISVFVAFFITSIRWEKEFLLTLLLLWIPKVSDAYVMIFMIIPFTTFINDMKQRKENGAIPSWKDIIPAVLFAVLFMPIALPELRSYRMGGYVLTYSYIVYFICLIMLAISVVSKNYNQGLQKKRATRCVK